MLLVGQSNNDGGPTSDPNYGGRAVVGGTYWKDGTQRTTWPSQTGPAPYILRALVEAGVPDPLIVNRAVASTSIVYAINPEMVNASADLVTIGEDDFDVVILWQGEHESTTQVLADGYAVNLELFLSAARSRFPGALIVGTTLLTTDTGPCPYYATVDAALRAGDFDALIDTHDPYVLPTVDNIHCTTGQGGGYSTYGARFGALIRELFG